MALLNYTTEVPVSRSASQVQARLVEHGAREVLFNYDDQGNIDALSFVIETPHGKIPIRMPLNIDATCKVLERQADEKIIPRRYANPGHARRVAWRILKDWLEAQLSLLETEMVKMEEIFLPYVLIGNKETVYQVISKGGFKALPGGRGEES